MDQFNMGLSQLFLNYIGVDYSGAATSDTPLPGIRVYQACRDQDPTEIRPSALSSRWTRQSLAEWVDNQLTTQPRTIIGMDFGFSAPISYFDAMGIPHTWDAFLSDFCAHWPTDHPNIKVDHIRFQNSKNPRCGSAKWRRITEQLVGAKSIFHFDVPGSVAKSTHAGLPWLNRIRHCHRQTCHVWPFDGWQVPNGYAVLAEVYPSLWSKQYPIASRTQDQHDAYSVSKWLKWADSTGQLQSFFDPVYSEKARTIGRFEGWILGVKEATCQGSAARF